MASEPKKESEIIKDTIAASQLSAWEKLPASEHKIVFSFGEEYKEFLRSFKTERECVNYLQKKAEKSGYVSLDKATLRPGTKFFIKHKDKNFAMGIIGKNGLDSPLRIMASHIDALRLDLKSSPIYEDGKMAFLNTHYYGGIKKWHWVNTPLALHGLVFTKTGQKVDINLGDSEDSPVFVIADLLPHIGGKALADKKITEFITGEGLDAIAATIPLAEKDAMDKVRLKLLQHLNKTYGIIEEDLLSAELQLVPAVRPRDVGFDESLIGGYAHDDRACSYGILRAIMDLNETPQHTSLVLFMDREETGSSGATGSESLFLENLVEQMAEKANSKKNSHVLLAESQIISADVTSAFDSKYREFFDPQNTNYAGFGVSIERGTGYGGKYEGSEASAEYLSFVRRCFEAASVPWQTGEIGKVDEGGGGTVAKYFAKYGCDIVDVGPPVLAMHSPFELISKVDLYCAYKGYKAFLAAK